MDNNTIIWSCSRRKFAQVMAKSEYQERLLHKFNSEWHLVIKIGDILKDSFGDRRRSTDPVWEILLKRNGGQQMANVTGKIIQSTSFPTTKKLSFSGGNQLKSIDEVAWEDIKHFFLDIVFVFEENSTTESSSHDNLHLSRLEDLSCDFQSMLDKGQFSDVVVKCSSLTMRAHKNILSARSSMLEALHVDPMMEQEETVVVIDDIEPDVCRAMLTYIYCGRLKELSLPLVSGLLHAAEKFKINGLNDGCVVYLRSIMSDENVLQIIEVADLYDKGLKKFGIKFLSDRFNGQGSAEVWETFKSKYPLLALQIYSRLNNQ